MQRCIRINLKYTVRNFAKTLRKFKFCLRLHDLARRRDFAGSRSKQIDVMWLGRHRQNGLTLPKSAQASVATVIAASIRASSSPVKRPAANARLGFER